MMSYSLRAAELSSLLFLVVFISSTVAKEHLIGGKPNAWKVPSSQSEYLNKWAESKRFQVGDYLVWSYDASKDSVLQVTKADYDACNTANPIAVYKDGNAKVKLDRSGAFYFISGVEGNCKKEQKLVTVVMAQRGRFFRAMSPAPYPADVEGPAVAPSPTSGGASLKGGVVIVFLGTFLGVIMV